MQRTISIIIPVYNVEQYLERCLKSIEQQTYSDLEVVLIDDGSKDKSGEICDDWEKKDKRFKVVHQKNFGVSCARNIGFRKSIGEYIIFLDADDEIHPAMLEKMMDKFCDDKVDSVWCGYKNIYYDKTVMRVPQKSLLIGNEILAAIYNNNYASAVWNKLFKRQVLLNEENQFIGFSEKIYIAEDYLWLAKVLQNCKKVVCIKDCFYDWYRREDSATQAGKRSLSEKWCTELNALSEIVNIYQDISNDLYYVALRKYFMTLREEMFVADREGDELAYKFEKELKKIMKKYPYKKKRDIVAFAKVRFIFILKRLKFGKGIICFFEDSFRLK